MSRILCVCDQGNNRSVTAAWALKYLGHDCIPVGLKRNAPDTLDMLFDWADHIVVTEAEQSVPPEYADKVRVWDVGPDEYPRPMNKALLNQMRAFVARDREVLA